MSRNSLNQVQRRAEFLGYVHELFVAARCEAAHLPVIVAHVADGFDDISRAGFALGADHRGAFGNAPQRFAQIRAPQTNGTLKLCFQT